MVHYGPPPSEANGSIDRTGWVLKLARAQGSLARSTTLADRTQGGRYALALGYLMMPRWGKSLEP